MADEAIEPVEAPAEAEVETPSEDEILKSLSDTEDEAPDTEAKVDETDDKEVTEDETTPEDEQKPEEEDDQPLDPKEVARERYAARKQVQAERAERVKAQTEAYINEEGLDDIERRTRAIEAKDYAREIEHNEQTLINEYERVTANPDLQIFNQDSDQFNKPLYDKAVRDFSAGYIQEDEAGNMVGIKGSLFEHLKETAELYQMAVKTGQVKQVRDSRTMKNNASPKPAAQPKEVTKDSILDILQSD